MNLIKRKSKYILTILLLLLGVSLISCENKEQKQVSSYNTETVYTQDIVEIKNNDTKKTIESNLNINREKEGILSNPIINDVVFVVFASLCCLVILYCIGEMYRHFCIMVKSLYEILMYYIRKK